MPRLSVNRNKKNYDTFIHSLKKDFKGKYLVCFDFDDVLSNSNLGLKMFLKRVVRPSHWHGFFRMFSVHPELEYVKLVYSITSPNFEKDIESNWKEDIKACSWNPGAVDLLRKLQKSKNFYPVIISKSLASIIKLKLKKEKLKIPVVAGAVNYKRGVFDGVKVALLFHFKPHFVEFAKKSFEKTFAFGHDYADIFLLDSADVAIGFNPDFAASSHCDYKIDDFAKAIKILEKETGSKV